MATLSVSGKERKEKSDEEVESLLCGQEEAVMLCQVTPSLSPLSSQANQVVREDRATKVSHHGRFRPQIMPSPL